MSKTQIAIEAPADPQVKIDEKKAQAAANTDKVEVPTELEPSVVRSVLKAMGQGINSVAHDEDVKDQWKFTDAELDGLTPPLTRYINRVPKLREAVVKADYATIAIYLGGYVGRNFDDGRKAKKTRKERDEQQGEAGKPANAVRAGVGTGGGGSSVAPSHGVAGGQGHGGGQSR